VRDALLLSLGAGLLYWGADWLVKGAAGLARELGVRPVVIGLTVVAYGTSMPEVVVSGAAALGGKGAIALGNVVGSNIANLGLILALTALVSPPLVEGTLIKKEVPVFAVTAVLVPLLLLNGVVSRYEALLLLAMGALFTWWTLRGALEAGPDEPLVAQTSEEATARAAAGKRWKLAALSSTGLALLLAGGEGFVRGATGVARSFGISEWVIGLTVVAVGTSLPELASSLVAAVRGHAGLAVGNVVGSNIFNILFVLGSASLARPIERSLGEMRADLAVLVGFTLAGVVSLRGHRHVSRLEGALLLGAYAAYVAFLARAT